MIGACKVSAEYKMVVSDCRGKARVNTGWFTNLVTDSGLEALASSVSIKRAAVRCYVGSGSTPPSVGDVSLVNPVANASSDGEWHTKVTEPEFYLQAEWRYTFPVGAAEGNLSEVGTSQSSGPPLFSRALIKDSAGSPTTITVLPNEILTVYYRLRVYPDMSDRVGVVNISGVNYNYTLRPARINYQNWTTDKSASMGSGPLGGAGHNIQVSSEPIASITDEPSGLTSAGSATLNPYVSGSLERAFTYTIEPSRGNISGGIRSIVFATSIGQYQVEVEPRIPKTQDDILTLTFKEGPISRMAE